MSHAAEALCEALNRGLSALSASQAHSDSELDSSALDSSALTAQLKGALLRELIVRLAEARGLLHLSPSERSSPVAIARLLNSQPSRPELPRLLSCGSLDLIEAQLSAERWERYLKALDEVASGARSWATLSESTLGALSEGLIGRELKQLKQLSLCLITRRAQTRWFPYPQLLRALRARPSLARLQRELGLSATQAKRLLKRIKSDASSPSEQRSALQAALEREGLHDERLLNKLSPLLAITQLSAAGSALVAHSGELVWVISDAQKRRGAHYTPYGLAREAVSALLPAEPQQGHRQALSARLDWFSQTRVCDPAVGAGVFLIEYARALVARSLSRCAQDERPPLRAELLRELTERSLFGVDLDPLSVELTRASLWLLASPHAPLRGIDRHILCADSISAGLNESPWRELKVEGGFERVVCNPPYLNGIERALSEHSARDVGAKALYPHSAHGTYDGAERFWERCCQLLSEQGRYALIIPTVQLAHEGPFKRWLHQQWRPTKLKLFSLGSFSSARVRTSLVIGQRGASAEVELASDDPQLPITGSRRASWAEESYNWYRLLSSASAPLGSLELERAPQRLSDHFEVHAGCATGAAYELSAQLQRRSSSSNQGPMLITTGLIERYHQLWGRRETRYLKRDYKRPRWPAEPEERSLRAALHRQRGPKLLVAGLSAVLEAVFDGEGACAGVVQTWVITPRAELSSSLSPQQLKERCELLCVYLNSAALSYHFVERHGAAAMSGRQITVKKQSLLSLPLPKLSEPEALSELLKTRAEELTLRLERLLDAPEPTGCSSLEREALMIMIHRELRSLSTARLNQAQGMKLSALDELAHRLVSERFTQQSEPLISWWRARAQPQRSGGSS